jgi:hypothetical protein
VTATPPPDTPTPVSTIGCGEGFGPIAKWLCDLQTTITPAPGDSQRGMLGAKFNAVMSSILGFLTIVGGLWFFIQFILGGYAWISSGGDKSSLETARNKIFNAVIGLIVVVSAWVIVGLVGKIVGLDILNPGAIIQFIGL